MKLAAPKTKLAELKERHALSKVELEVFQEYKLIYENEISRSRKKFTEEGIEKSNLEKFINHALKMRRNLGQMWVSANYEDKYRLQKLVFSAGIRYNRQNGHYRTGSMNFNFAVIAGQTWVSEKKKEKNQM